MTRTNLRSVNKQSVGIRIIKHNVPLLSSDAAFRLKIKPSILSIVGGHGHAATKVVKKIKAKRI